MHRVRLLEIQEKIWGLVTHFNPYWYARTNAWDYSSPYSSLYKQSMHWFHCLGDPFRYPNTGVFYDFRNFKGSKASVPLRDGSWKPSGICWAISGPTRHLCLVNCLASLQWKRSSLWTIAWVRTSLACRCLPPISYLNPHLSPICFFFSEGPEPLKPLDWFYYCTTQETLTTQHHSLDIQ